MCGQGCQGCIFPLNKPCFALKVKACSTGAGKLTFSETALCVLLGSQSHGAAQPGRGPLQDEERALQGRETWTMHFEVLHTAERCLSYLQLQVPGEHSLLPSGCSMCSILSVRLELASCQRLLTTELRMWLRFQHSSASQQPGLQGHLLLQEGW